MLLFLFVGEMHVVSDLDMFIDDRFFNQTVFADGALLEMVAQENGISNDGASLDPGAHPNNAARDLLGLNAASFADDRLGDLGAEDFWSGKGGGSGVDRLLLIVGV